MDFKEIAFHAALKQACKEAGYDVLEVSVTWIRAYPSKRQLAMIAKQFELVVHTVTFGLYSGLSRDSNTFDQITLGSPDDPDRQRITCARSYDL